MKKSTIQPSARQLDSLACDLTASAVITSQAGKPNFLAMGRNLLFLANGKSRVIGIAIERRTMITRSESKFLALLDEVGWNRDVNHVRKLLSEGADVNGKDVFEHTPLHRALTAFPRCAFVELKNELDKSGSSGKYAGESNVWEIIETRIRRAADVVDLLLQSGAEVNTKSIRGKDTPLHLTMEVGKLDYIFTYVHEIWPEIEWTGPIETWLSKAANQTAVRIVELLLSNGADVNASGPDELSSESKSSRAQQLGADAKARDKEGETPLLHALKRGVPSILELLLKHGADVNARDDKKATPLHAAVDTRSTQMVELLLKHGADVNARDEEGATPLFRALNRCVPRILELLVEHGADVNALQMDPEEDFGWSPLNYAVMFLSPTIMTFLLDRGANVNPQGTPKSPLHFAMHRFSPSIAKLLLERGANVNARDIEGNTPLHYLLHIYCLDSFKDLLDVLIEYGADLEARDYHGRTPILRIEHGIGNFMKEPKQLLAAINQVFSHGVGANSAKILYRRLTRTRRFKSGKVEKSIFINHIKQLVALNTIGMAKKNRPLFFDIMNPFKKDFTRLEQNHQAKFSLEENGDNLYESCLNEVGKLNTIQIFQNFTLADVLTLADPVILASVSNNVVFQRYAQFVDLSSKFPNYAFVINHQYQRGLQMQLLCEKCEVSLRIMSSGKLHRYCAYKVLKYLSEIDLMNLAEAQH